MNLNLHLTIHTRTLDAHAAVVDLAGEMDIYTTPQAKEAMLDLVGKGYHHLVVNLQQVEYLDSTALGALVGMLKRAREQGGSLRLVAPSAKIRRLLEITRLIHVFPIDATEQEATANLTQEGMRA